jgi:hypothetical protein
VAGIQPPRLHAVEPVVDGPCLIRLGVGARLERVCLRWWLATGDAQAGTRGQVTSTLCCPVGAQAARRAGAGRRWLIRARRSSG